MLWKKVDTDAVIAMQHGSSVVPVATLADNYGGRAQIIWDDGCYVICLVREGNVYVRSPFIFPEAFDILQTLPSPARRRVGGDGLGKMP